MEVGVLSRLLTTVDWTFLITAIAIRFFVTRRIQFQSLLRSSQSGLDSTQYLRLIALAGSDTILILPLNLYILIVESSHPQPFNWHAVHYDFSAVHSITLDLFGQYFVDSAHFAIFLITHWLCPILAFIFFLYFGVAEDVTGEYVRWYVRVKGWLHIEASGPIDKQ